MDLISDKDLHDDLLIIGYNYHRLIKWPTHIFIHSSKSYFSLILLNTILLLFFKCFFNVLKVWEIDKSSQVLCGYGSTVLRDDSANVIGSSVLMMTYDELRNGMLGGNEKFLICQCQIDSHMIDEMWKLWNGYPKDVTIINKILSTHHVRCISREWTLPSKLFFCPCSIRCNLTRRSPFVYLNDRKINYCFVKWHNLSTTTRKVGQCCRKATCWAQDG